MKTRQSDNAYEKLYLYNNRADQMRQITLFTRNYDYKVKIYYRRNINAFSKIRAEKKGEKAEKGKNKYTGSTSSVYRWNVWYLKNENGVPRYRVPLKREAKRQKSVLGANR